ncbi:MAG: hypothetical protein Q9171_007067 [Xanthocarpia ochracea]
MATIMFPSLDQGHGGSTPTESSTDQQTEPTIPTPIPTESPPDQQTKPSTPPPTQDAHNNLLDIKEPPAIPLDDQPYFEDITQPPSHLSPSERGYWFLCSAPLRQDTRALLEAGKETSYQDTWEKWNKLIEMQGKGEDWSSTERQERIMFIDFERSKSTPRARALQEITSNRQRLEADMSNKSPRAKSPGFEIYDDPIPSPKKDCAEPRKDDVGPQVLIPDLIELDEGLMIAQLWSEGKENVAPTTTTPSLIDEGKKCGPLTHIVEKQAFIVSPTKDDKPYIKLSKDRAVKQPTEDEDDKENILPIDVV